VGRGIGKPLANSECTSEKSKLKNLVETENSGKKKGRIIKGE